jgi:phosphotransferase system HPr-like phosphotransfer protein
MKILDIRLSTIEDVRNFVNEVTRCEFDVDLASGRYIVDAKSIMGIFSLDLLNPIRMTVHSDDCEAFLARVEKYVVK